MYIAETALDKEWFDLAAVNPEHITSPEIFAAA